MLRSAFRATQVANTASRDEAQYAEEYFADFYVPSSMTATCVAPAKEEVISLLEDQLVPHATEPEAKVFFLKNRADSRCSDQLCLDYYRYMAEFRGTHDEAVAHAREAYDEALDAVQDLAALTGPPQEHLAATHPIRLGMALSRAVFSHLAARRAACPSHGIRLALCSSYAPWIPMDEIPEEHYKDSTQILQMLRDYLTQWMGAE
eukprot:Skav231224  [mRNA]  locus=scaffold813:102944:108594:+ [translate_table: standard]